ncbi:MAG: two-component sensor histidine kinase [Bacteroidetes bacterium]|nr:two-component sensor histidine kinase [Bacteroidota bacterium]
MNIFQKKRLFIAPVLYWFLLAYTIVALVFWFIELQKQNQQMISYKTQELKMDDPAYLSKADSLAAEQRRKTAQYLGEGVTFLLVISVGAVFLLRAIMRQIKVQQQQQNFMMAVTHELKTPISVAKLNLETLQKYNLEEARQKKIIQSALQELSRLDTLANNILVSSQLEGGYYQMSRDELDFSALTQNAVQDFIHRFGDKQWQVNIQPGLSITGDYLLLQILVNNLVENAVKYSSKNKMITVNLTRENSNIVLQVKDEGPGVSPVERKKIFKKFYRIGNEQTRTTQGTGLGLYLCKKIATDHKAQIVVSDNHPDGSIFTVVF